MIFMRMFEDWQGFCESDCKRQLDVWHEQCVPPTGNFETVGGKIVKAICYLIDRWSTQGVTCGNGLSRNDCTAPAMYLASIDNPLLSSTATSLLNSGDEWEDLRVYELRLELLALTVYNYLKERPEVFEPAE